MTPVTEIYNKVTLRCYLTLPFFVVTPWVMYRSGTTEITTPMVLCPRYLLVVAADGGAGFYGYNSTYNLGIMTSVFFTELSLIGVFEPNDLDHR